MSKLYVLCLSFIVFFIVFDIAMIVEVVLMILSGIDLEIAIILIDVVSLASAIIVMFGRAILDLASREYEPPHHIQRP